MKKLVFTVIALLLFSVNLIVISADDSDGWEKSFIDDFELYSDGKVEEQSDFTDNWTNAFWSGSIDNGIDIDDVATIKTEGDNKYLNMDYTGSFFYMSPTNLRAKNFEVEFDTRSHDLTDAWVGISMRKAYRDVRYNGGTGMMLYFRTKYIENVDGDIIGESLAIQALRGGSLSTTDLNDELVGDQVIEYIYPTDGPIDANEQIKDNWFAIKIVVSETENDNEATYEVYIDDVLKTTLTYSRASLDIYGYISLHGCTGDLDVDNFKITVLDEIAPPPIVRINRLVDSLGSVGELFEFPGDEEGDIELIDDADDLIVVEIMQPNSEVLTLDAGVFSFTPTLAGVHTIRYVAVNAAGDQGVQEFLVNVQAAETEEPEDPIDEPEDPIDEPDEPIDEPSSGNNVGVIIISSVAGLGLIGAGTYFFIIKKK